MNLFKDWINLSKHITHSSQVISKLTCPNCQQLGINFQYVGDLETRIGYLAIWCSYCLHGIHISRVAIPKEAEALPFGVSNEELLRKIPNFIHVEPEN
jgi:hypothetical protein